jgi:hypothetical protein
MKERKKSANWYIAATHYLTSGFAIPFLIALAITFIVNLLPVLKTAVSTFFFRLIVINILAFWLGVMYSAGYLKRTYIMENGVKIVNLSTAYLVVLNVAYILFQVLSGKMIGSAITYTLIQFIVSATLFYVFSRKYLREA